MKIRVLISRVVVATQFTYTFSIYKSLPQVIPNAFDATGTPHRFAPRGILWFFVAMSLGVHILLNILARYPNAFNLPSDIADPDRPRQLAIAQNMMTWVELGMALLFASLTWQLAHESPQHRMASNVPFDMTIAALLCIAFVTVYRVRKKAA